MRNVKFWKWLQGLAVGLALLLLAVSSGYKEAGRPMEQGDGNEFVIEDGVLIMYTGTDTMRNVMQKRMIFHLSLWGDFEYSGTERYL